MVVIVMALVLTWSIVFLEFGAKLCFLRPFVPLWTSSLNLAVFFPRFCQVSARRTRWNYSFTATFHPMAYLNRSDPIVGPNSPIAAPLLLHGYCCY